MSNAEAVINPTKIHSGQDAEAIQADDQEALAEQEQLDRSIKRYQQSGMSLEEARMAAIDDLIEAESGQTDNAKDTSPDKSDNDSGTKPQQSAPNTDKDPKDDDIATDWEEEAVIARALEDEQMRQDWLKTKPDGVEDYEWMFRLESKLRAFYGQGNNSLKKLELLEDEVDKQFGLLIQHARRKGMSDERIGDGLEEFDVHAHELAAETINKRNSDPGQLRQQAPAVAVDNEKLAWEHINDNPDTINLYEDSTQHGRRLIAARSRLAEAMTAARSGSISDSVRKPERAGGNRKLQHAVKAYERARHEFLTQQMEAIGVKAADHEFKAAFLAALSAKEDGALMAESVYDYLEQQNQKSRFESLTGRSFDSLPRWAKVSLGVGAVATAGALGGLLGGAVLGGAAAGAVTGGKFGRRQFSLKVIRRRQQAKLRKDGQLGNEPLVAATLYRGNQAEYEEKLKELKELEATDDKDGRSPLLSFDYVVKAEDEGKGVFRLAASDISDERIAETKGKRKVAASVVGGAAVGAFISTFAPGLAEYSPGDGGEVPDADIDAPSEPLEDTEGSGSDPEADEAETEAGTDATGEAEAAEGDGVEDQDIAADTDTDTESETAGNSGDEAEAAQSDPAESNEVSNRAQQLYGELAGQEVSLEIPEGSNVWNQLEAAVEQEMPGIDEAEKQRLVGNMLKVMEQQYPGNDLNLVYPGDVFNITLPS